MLKVISWILVLMMVLMTVPLFVLLERKVLSYIQNRKGPKKVGVMGLFQSFADAGKLISKEKKVPFMSNLIFFHLSPLISMCLMVFSWYFFVFKWKNTSIQLSILFFLCISSLKVYSLLGSGWSSNSKYALVGAIRGATQVISYEMSLIFVIFFPCCLKKSYNFLSFFKSSYFFFLILFPLFFIWFSSCVAETNRAPFDFAEGESELVSGFNVEYGSLSFAFLFLSEYGSIILMSFISSFLFFWNNFFFVVLTGNFFCFCFIWVRASLPRFRIDFLMGLAWKMFLPLSMFFLFNLFVLIGILN